MDMTTTEDMPPVALNSNTTSLFQCTDDSGKYENIHDSLNLFGNLALLIIGTGGNVVTYNVFKQRAYRRNVMASMFRYLSVLDSMFLWTIVFQSFIKGLTGYHVTNTTNRGCLLLIFWDQLTLSLANWLLVVITVARLVHLKYPLKSETICSRLNYNLLLIATHIFVICVHGESTLFTHSRLSEADYNSGKNCFYHISRTDVYGLREKILYCVVSFLAPAFLLVICNAAIILKMRDLKKQGGRLFHRRVSTSIYLQEKSAFSDEFAMRDKTQNARDWEEVTSRPSSADLIMASINTSTNNVEDSHQYEGASQTVDTEVTLRSSRSQVAATSRKRHSIRTWISEARSHGVDMDCEEDYGPEVDDQEMTAPGRERNNTARVRGAKPTSRSYTLTLMLIAASSIFLVLNTPFWVIHFGFIKSITDNPSIGCSLRYLILDLVLFLRNLNNTLNFAFYCAIGDRFRQDVCDWFRSLRR